jgi:GNAT superfamily N-acetyltransferase
VSALALAVTDAPTDAEFAAVTDGLNAFNERQHGPSNFRMLMVIVRDPAGTIVGGIYAMTHWGWLYIQRLWVAESERGQRLAGRMLAAAEDEARARGCHGAWIDTFNPTALQVYQRAGYARFGELPDFPRGHTRTFLSKQLM